MPRTPSSPTTCHPDPSNGGPRESWAGGTAVARVDAYAKANGQTFRAGLREAAAAGVAGRALSGIHDLLGLLTAFERYAVDGVARVMEAVLEHTGYLAELETERSIEAQGRIENLQELVGVAREVHTALDAGGLSRR